MAQIFYQHPVFFGMNQIKFYQVEVHDDDNLQNMFCNHEYSRHNLIELYVFLQQPQLSQPIESQVVDPIKDEQDGVDAVDEEEEDP